MFLPMDMEVATVQSKKSFSAQSLRKLSQHRVLRCSSRSRVRLPTMVPAPASRQRNQHTLCRSKAVPLIARGGRVLLETRFQHLLKEIDRTHCEGQMPARVQATPVCCP